MMNTATNETSYELTPTQEAMLLYSLYAPNSPAYLEQFGYAYRGSLNVPTFKSAWQRLIDRHSSLRTSFQLSGIPWFHDSSIPRFRRSSFS